MKKIRQSQTAIRQIETIKRMVGEEFGFTAAEINGSDKRIPLPIARQVAMFIARTLVAEAKASLVWTAKAFNRKNHGSILYAIRGVEELCRDDSAFKARSEALTRKIQFALAAWKPKIKR